MLSRVHHQVASQYPDQGEAVQQLVQPATASQLLQQQQILQEQLIQQQQQLQKQLQEQQNQLQQQLSQQQQEQSITIQYGVDHNSQDAEGVKTEDGIDSKRFQKHLIEEQHQGVGHLLIEQPLNLVTTSIHHTSTVHTPSVSLLILSTFCCEFFKVHFMCC